MPPSGPEWKFNQLFGRETETELLQSLISNDENDNKHATVILHGSAGSGKSSLIQGQQRLWEEKGWLLATGKFESHRTGEPFSALTEAISGLVEDWCHHNSMQEVCQMGGFRSLLKEDIQFLRNIVPKAYLKAKGGQCMPPSAAHDVDGGDDYGGAADGDESGPLSWNKHERSGSFTMKQDLATVDCVNASFVRILNFLAMARPIMLFLDDVHFADRASLDVLQLLATTQEVKNLVLILSYRDEEACECGDCLMDTLTNIKEGSQKKEQQQQPTINQGEAADTAATRITSESSAGQPTAEEAIPKETSLSAGQDTTEEAPTLPVDESESGFDDSSSSDDNLGTLSIKSAQVHELVLGDLSVESVNRLVASVTQRMDLQETLPLAEVVHKKTAGNPFFVTQFLQMLRQEEFLRYSFSTFQWEWGDVANLESAAHVSDNVAEIIAKTIQSLPLATSVALKVASCLGKIIPLQVLVEWFEAFYDEQHDGDTCCEALREVKLQGLQNVLDQAVDVGILIRPGGHDTYSWAHDRLQTVAYSLIEPEEHRIELHMRLGRHLWGMSRLYPQEEWMIFMAADQMNRFCEFCPDNALGMGAEVATLCLEAAKLSLRKSALYPAFDMVQAGVRHLHPKDRWSLDHYDLTLRLYSTQAELAVQLGKREEAKTAVMEVEANAKSTMDKFRVQLVYLKCITGGSDRNYKLGVDKTIEILRDGYGIRIPAKLFPGQLMLECQKLRRKFPGGKLEGLLQLPLMTDAKSRNIMKLLVSNLGVFSYMTPKHADLGWYAALRALNISAEKGVSEETALAVAAMGSAIRQQGRYTEANEYAELALRVIERFPQNVGSIHSSIIGFVTGGVYSATKPLNKCLDLWLECHHVALRTGVTEKAAGAILGYTLTYITVGLPLGPLMSDLGDYEKEARQFNLPESVLAVFKILQQFIANVQEVGGENPTRLKGEFMNERRLLSTFSGNAERMTRRDINTFRLLLAVIYGDMKAAEPLIAELEPYVGTDVFVVRSGLRDSTIALAAYKLSRSGTGKNHRKLRQLAKKITKGFREELKKGNVNAAPLYFMLEAEESPSKEHYENAIRSCARLGLIHFEAYMCEQAAYYFMTDENVKDEGWAEFYLAQAFALAEDWGATGKAYQLKQNYPKLLRSASLLGRANSALKGRTRYSSSHSDLLKDFGWDLLGSSSSSMRSLGNREEGDLTESDVSSDSGSMSSGRRSSGSLLGGYGLFGSPLS